MRGFPRSVSSSADLRRLHRLRPTYSFQVSPAELEDSLCASPLVQDAGVTSVYHDDHATEYPRAYVVPFDKEVLQGGPKAEEFAHTLRKHIEGKHAPYKWCVATRIAEVWEKPAAQC